MLKNDQSLRDKSPFSYADSFSGSSFISVAYNTNEVKRLELFSRIILPLGMLLKRERRGGQTLCAFEVS
jgi:hypothetical protein